MLRWQAWYCVLYITLYLASKTSYCQKEGYHREFEYEPYDGWYNNAANPDWGAAETPLQRRLAPDYSDGVYRPRGEGSKSLPNPLLLAHRTMNGLTGRASYQKRTALLVYFGQQVVEEVLDAQRPGCPPEYFDIPYPDQVDGHPYINETTVKAMPFLRSRYAMQTGQSPNNPRQQLNEITSFIDGGLVYGTTKAWSDTLREFEGGRLACSDESCQYPRYNTIGLPMANPPPPFDHVLKSSRRFFMLGNPRGNENPFLLTMGIIWFREHNRWANRLQQQHPDWSDEQLYQRARQFVIAEYQKIVLYDWLPAFLGVGAEDSNPDCTEIQCTDRPERPTVYEGYKPHVHPGIVHAFQSAAMRFGHTMVTPGVYPRKPGNCSFGKPMRTCNSYWNPIEPVLNGGVEDLILGMSTQICEREDNIITEDLQGKVFGPLEFSRRDLMALNIQRGRDHGLPDYNSMRKAYGLNHNTFDEINQCVCPDSTVKKAIEQAKILYRTDKDIDVWVGGLLETTPKGPGPLFRAIIKDQFERIRDGDRFWFENRDNGLFNNSEIRQILRTTFQNIIVLNTNIPPNELQDDVFHITPSHRCYSNSVNNQLSQFHMDNCTKWQTFDYWEGSAGAYLGTIFGLGLYTILLLITVYFGKLYKMGRLPWNRKKKQTDRPSYGGSIFAEGGGVIRLVAEELKVDGNHSRQVGILVNAEEKFINICDPESLSCLRRIDLSNTRKIEFHTSFDDGTLLLLRFPHLYDLVLQLKHESDCDFLRKDLKETLEKLGIGYDDVIKSRSRLLVDAFTKEDRQELVERFFRELFKEAFGPVRRKTQKSLAKATLSKTIGVFRTRFGRKIQPRDLVKCELTKSEFASSLGMKSSSMFVEQIFNVADEDNSGTIAYQEMLAFLVQFVKGDSENKLRLIYRIYNTDGSGVLKRSEFRDMLKHLLEGANTRVENTSFEQTLESMFSNAGLSNQEELYFEDFQRLFSPHLDRIMPGVRLEFPGVDTQPALQDNLPVAHSPRAPRKDSSGDQTLSAPSDENVERSNSLLRRRSKKANAEHHKTESFVSAYHNPQDLLQSSGGAAGIQISPMPMADEIGDESNVTPFAQNLLAFRRFVSNYQSHIFWLVLYEIVVMLIFAERAYYYSVEREHRGLRRIAGYGVTVTRGAASAMMFTYSTLLVTMCRNLITQLRETFFNRFIPFDAAHSFHKLVAMTALFFTVMHVIGHCINFYHISTQTADDLTCLFRNFYHYSNELPDFNYWMYSTLTGVTGFILTLVVATMYIFALPVARQYLYFFFWKTHQLYVVLYILLVLHGSGRLVQLPIFQWFFVGPAVLYTVDRLISLSRRKVELDVLKADILPSNVTCLQFRRPDNFEYKSGQWVRIACLAQSSLEYHPFTLTSAPHEDTLSVHVRAVGPWTRNLRSAYNPEDPRIHRAPDGRILLPRLYLDGPFGEGHQDWYKYSVSVLVGGGIGVTPFASILKDIVHRLQTNVKLPCRKIYFLWVTRTQRQFEWFTDIIRQVEEEDSRNLIDIHVFITQFYQKFDLRTTMLYICERHFQKISNRSLFTGLRSMTHFGRPEFTKVLYGIQEFYVGKEKKIGVFSCGPPPMTQSVQAGCDLCNQFEGPLVIHHYENF